MPHPTKSKRSVVKRDNGYSETRILTKLAHAGGHTTESGWRSQQQPHDSSLEHPSMGRLHLSFAKKGQGACVFSREEMPLWVHSCTKAAEPGEEIRSDVFLPHLSTRHTQDSQPDIAGRSGRLEWYRCWILQQRQRH